MQKEKLKARLTEGVPSLNAQIEIDRKELFNSFRDIKKFRDYAAGKQDTTLTIEQQKILEGVLGNEYCDNICGQILGEHAGRLELKSISCPDKNVQDWISSFWQKANWDDLQQRTHRTALKDGNTCLHVQYDYDKERICIHRERWWDGRVGVFIGYDSFGDILYAVKEWNTPIGKRRAVYYEGAIERYASLGGSNTWLPFILPSDANTLGITPGIQQGFDSISIPYVDSNNNPLHVPFIHFTNPGDEFENYGSSIYDGGKIGAQDMVNDAQYDASATGRMTGYQRTWSKGFKLMKVGGKTVQPRTGPGTHYHADSAEAEWGVLTPGSVQEIIAIYDLKVRSFCRMTGTPYHAVTGNWPSGEAVYKFEQPIRAATRDRQKRNAGPWVETMHRSIELANAIENEGLDENQLLTAVYSDAGDRDPLTVAMADAAFWQGALAAVQAGMPLAMFLRVQGWGDDNMKGISTAIMAELDKLPPPVVTIPGSSGANTASNNITKPTAKTQQTAKKQG